MGEVLQDKALGAAHGYRSVAFAEGVVEKTGKNMQLFFQAAEAVEKLLLGFTVHHKVGAGDQQLCGHLNRLGIGYNAIGSVVQPEQHIH